MSKPDYMKYDGRRPEPPYTTEQEATPQADAVQEKELIDELFDRLLNRSSHCMVQDGAGKLHDAVRAKLSDLHALKSALDAALAERK